MAFIPFSKVDGNKTGLTITADRYQRLCLNTEVIKELTSDEKEVYLFWDPEDRRLGLSKTCMDKRVVPFTFDARGYIQGKAVKEFLHYCEVDSSSAAIKFYYEGMEGDVYVFGQRGRRALSFKQSRNGDLERLR